MNKDPRIKPFEPWEDTEFLKSAEKAMMRLCVISIVISVVAAIVVVVMLGLGLV